MSQISQKNKTAKTDGNQSIDDLLYMLESTSVLSETFKQRLISMCLWILLAKNKSKNHAEIEKGIEEIEADLNRLSIFSESFIKYVVGKLKLGHGWQKAH